MWWEVLVVCCIIAIVEENSLTIFLITQVSTVVGSIAPGGENTREIFNFVILDIVLKAVNSNLLVALLLLIQKPTFKVWSKLGQ